MSSAVQESTYTIGNTATALGSNGFAGRAGVVVFNAGGGGNIYLGGPNVTTGTGLSLASNATPITINTPEGAALYGVASLAGTIVRIIEF